MAWYQLSNWNVRRLTRGLVNWRCFDCGGSAKKYFIWHFINSCVQKKKPEQVQEHVSLSKRFWIGGLHNSKRKRRKSGWKKQIIKRQLIYLKVQDPQDPSISIYCQRYIRPQITGGTAMGPSCMWTVLQCHRWPGTQAMCPTRGNACQWPPSPLKDPVPGPPPDTCQRPCHPPTLADLCQPIKSLAEVSILSTNKLCLKTARFGFFVGLELVL